MTMNRRVSPTLIGAFVLGAVMLAVIAVVLIGSGHFLRRTSPFVLYFSGSVNGLRLGAPVKFRGVEIGSVQDIRLHLQPDQSVSADTGHRRTSTREQDHQSRWQRDHSEQPGGVSERDRWRAPGAAPDRELCHRGAVCGAGLFPRYSGHLCPAAAHPKVPIPRDSDRAVFDREGAIWQ